MIVLLLVSRHLSTSNTSNNASSNVNTLVLDVAVNVSGSP